MDSEFTSFKETDLRWIWFFAIWVQIIGMILAWYSKKTQKKWAFDSDSEVDELEDFFFFER